MDLKLKQLISLVFPNYYRKSIIIGKYFIQLDYISVLFLYIFIQYKVPVDLKNIIFVNFFKMHENEKKN